VLARQRREVGAGHTRLREKFGRPLLRFATARIDQDMANVDLFRSGELLRLRAKFGERRFLQRGTIGGFAFGLASRASASTRSRARRSCSATAGSLSSCDFSASAASARRIAMSLVSVVTFRRIGECLAANVGRQPLGSLGQHLLTGHGDAVRALSQERWSGIEA